MEHHILLNICAIFGIATAVILICNKLKIRYVIGYLITGVLLSPNTSTYFADMEEVEVYAEIGIILLLFTVGLEFSFSNLKKIKKYVLIGGGTQVLFTIILTAFLVWLVTKPSLGESLTWGFLYALSSTAIVIKTMQDRNLLTTQHGKFVLAVLLFQDIMIVPLILLIPILGGAGGSLGTELGMLAGKLILMGGVAYLLARFIVPFLLKLVSKVKSQEVFLIAVIFVVTGVALLTEALGLSLALGAFIAGLIIAETDYHRVAISCFLPFRYVFMSFFFIAMGMLLDYRIFLEEPLWIAFWLIFAFMVKLVSGTLSARTVGLGMAGSLAGGISIAQIGEFSFVLAQEGVQYKLISETNYQIFLAISILLMSASPILVSDAQKISNRLIPSAWQKKS